MAVTSIDKVTVDKEEYSKFEKSRKDVEVRIFVTGVSDTLNIELRKARRSRTVSVATKTLTVSATHTSNTPLYVTFDLVKDAVQSPDLYSLIRRGQYFIKVEASSSVSTALTATGNINDTTLTVTSTAAFPDSGELEINSGGTTSETVAYSSKTATTFTLESGLQNLHAVAETVTLFNVTGESPDFGINIVTAAQLRDTYLFGIDLQSSDVRMPKFQPRKISGVEVLEVSRNHPLSFYPLNYIVDAQGTKFLSWADGDLVEITDDYTKYLLPCGEVEGSAEFIEVSADFYRMPASSVKESLLIDEFEMTDDMIRSFISKATDSLEFHELQVYLEPTQLVTDIDVNDISFSDDGNSIVINTDYDFIVTPINFYPRSPGHWISIQFPFAQVIDITELYGAVANTRVVHINYEWIEVSPKSGFAQLVPFNTEIAFDFTGLIWVESLHSATPIPNFWHYNAVAGLRDVPANIIKLLGMTAAIPILTVAGQAFRGGFSSQSISRDGVSESVSYTSSAIYGIYSASIEEYKKWIEENLPSVRNYYRGILLTTL